MSDAFQHEEVLHHVAWYVNRIVHDVKHKIQQDTYIQRARMFGSRGDYLRFFELTIPTALYVDWHRCFVFHRLALAAIKDGLGSLVWLTDQRIAPVASSSIDRSTVDMERREMSFGLFDYSSNIEAICLGNAPSLDKLDLLAKTIGDTAFPEYLRRYIKSTAIGSSSIFVHKPPDISGYTNAEGLVDTERVYRRQGFYGKSQENQAPASAVHRLIIFHNGDKKARLFYKFMGSIQFIKNTAHDP
jgi:hypothetical protein